MEPVKSLTGASFLTALAFLLAAASADPGPREAAEGPEESSKESPRTESKDAASPQSGELEFLPRAEGKSRPLRLTAGEVHLVILLQALADSTGMKVVLAGGKDREEETVRLPNAIPEPDGPSISSALRGAGYSVSEESLRGRKVLWITRELKPASRRGTIIRPGEDEDSLQEGKSPRSPSREPGAVRIFHEGEGAAGSWLVILETRSRAEAEEAASLLRSYLESRASRRTGEPVPGAKARGK